MSNKEIGKYGEDLASEYLVKNNIKIIERNYRYSKYGEIDIIALDKDELCFVEVKTRTSDKFGTPLEAITKEKLLRIYSCIKEYTNKTSVKYKKARIDAISIELTTEKPIINHVKNIELQ